jgi:hypothetical protein
MDRFAKSSSENPRQGWQATNEYDVAKRLTSGTV